MFHIWSQNEVQAFWVDHNSDGVYHKLMQNCWLNKECQLELKSHDNHGRIYMKFLVFQKMQMKLPSKRPVIGMAKKSDSVVWVQPGWLDHDRWCRYPNAQIKQLIFWSLSNRNELRIVSLMAFEEIYSRWLAAERFWRDPSPTFEASECNDKKPCCNPPWSEYHGE